MVSIEHRPTPDEFDDESKETKKIPEKLENKPGTQVFSSVLEPRSLHEVKQEKSPDLKNFEKEVEFDLSEADRFLKKLDKTVDEFNAKMESNWKIWRDKVREMKFGEAQNFEKFRDDFEGFSKSVLANYEETRKNLFDKWQDFYNFYLDLENFDSNAESDFSIHDAADKNHAQFVINQQYKPKVVDYLGSFQKFDQRFAAMEQQWVKLTELFKKYVIDKGESNYKDYKRMSKVSPNGDDFEFDIDSKMVDEKFDVRADNAKEVESLWSKYNYTENLYQFLKAFLATKNFGVSDKDLYEKTDLEYALVSDLALDKKTKLSGWSTDHMLEYYHSLPTRYPLIDLMGALAAFQRGEIKNRYADKNNVIDQETLNLDSYYLKIIKDLVDTPEPLERLSKKSGDTIPPVKVNY
jgi:hypothetical protein